MAKCKSKSVLLDLTVEEFNVLKIVVLTHDINDMYPHEATYDPKVFENVKTKIKVKGTRT